MGVILIFPRGPILNDVGVGQRTMCGLDTGKTLGNGTHSTVQIKPSNLLKKCLKVLLSSKPPGSSPPSLPYYRAPLASSALSSLSSASQGWVSAVLWFSHHFLLQSSLAVQLGFEVIPDYVDLC
jgi:hypothetical protein